MKQVGASPTHPPDTGTWRALQRLLEQELEKAHREEAEASRHRALLDHLPSAVLVEDENRRVVAANTRFCEMFHLPVSADALFGEDCELMAEQAAPHFAEPEQFLRRIDELLDGRTSVLNEEIHTADGRVLERDYIPVFVAGRYRGHLWSYVDVTDAHRDAARLRKALDDAESATRAKDAFLANVSHELRTPLTVVLGATQLVLQTQLDEEQRESLEATHRASNLLLGLLNDILDYSKIESGKLELVVKPFDLWLTLTDAADALRPVAEQKGLGYDLVIAPTVPRWVSGDPLRLKQVLINLLSNAVKYTPRGRVQLTVELDSSEGKRARVRFCVSDTGPGIASSVQARLFEPFVQGDVTSAQRAGGTGLGLSISKQLTELMGGVIEIDSQLGRGSRFTVLTWLERSSQSGTLRAITNPPGLPLAANRELRGRVLVAEDNELTQRLLQRALENVGLDVTLVGNGRDAVDAALDGDFDIILLDCQMPIMDGYEAARRIRGARADVPIIAVTAHAVRGEREKCLAAGMSDFIAKPFELGDIRAALARWLDADSQRDSDPAYDLQPQVDAAVRAASLSIPALPALEELSATVRYPRDDGISPELAATAPQIPPPLTGAPPAAREPGMERAPTVRVPVVRESAVARRAVEPADGSEPPAHGRLEGQPINLAQLEAVADSGTPEETRELMQEVAALFIADANSRLNELDKAHSERDPNRLRRSAHALKGGAGNVGAERVAELCERLERGAPTLSYGQRTELLMRLRVELERAKAALEAELL